MTFILALDQGTSSSRSLIVAADGRILAQAQQETKQYYPRTDWVEHDPQEILDTQFQTARQAIEQAGLVFVWCKSPTGVNYKDCMPL